MCSRPSIECFGRVLDPAKELRNRESIDRAMVRVDELFSVQELIRDARKHTDASALKRPASVLEGMKHDGIPNPEPCTSWVLAAAH